MAVSRGKMPGNDITIVTMVPPHDPECKCYPCCLARAEARRPRAHNCRFEYCTAPAGECPHPE